MHGVRRLHEPLATRPRGFAVLAAALTLWGCGLITDPDPSDALDLRISPALLEPGEELTATLTNVGDRPASYSFCLGWFEEKVGDEKTGGTWVERHSVGGVCTTVLQPLDPGATVALTRSLDAPGTYRLNLPVAYGGRAEDLLSQPFLITEP